jgi:hypothetical protein
LFGPAASAHYDRVQLMDIPINATMDENADVDIILPEPDDTSFLQILALMYKQDLRLNDNVRRPELSDIVKNVAKTDPTRFHSVISSSGSNSSTGSHRRTTH